MTGGFASTSARANPDAILNFKPLSAPIEAMPVLQRPMRLPRVLGSIEESNSNSQQQVVSRIVRMPRQQAARRTPFQVLSQPVETLVRQIQTPTQQTSVLMQQSQTSSQQFEASTQPTPTSSFDIERFLDLFH